MCPLVYKAIPSDTRGRVIRGCLRSDLEVSWLCLCKERRNEVEPGMIVNDGIDYFLHMNLRRGITTLCCAVML